MWEKKYEKRFGKNAAVPHHLRDTTSWIERYLKYPARPTLHTIRLAWLTALPLSVHSRQAFALRDELGDQALRTALHIQ